MPLRAHYRGDPDVEVIVDQRAGEWQPESRAVDERRGGHDRRRPAVPRDLARTLPPELCARAAKLRWEQRLRPVRRRLQDTPLDALLGLIADGDEDANSELYWRYAHRVRARLASRRVDPRRLDTAMRQAFGPHRRARARRSRQPLVRRFRRSRGGLRGRRLQTAGSARPAPGLSRSRPSRAACRCGRPAGSAARASDPPSRAFAPFLDGPRHLLSRMGAPSPGAPALVPSPRRPCPVAVTSMAFPQPR